MRYKGTGKLNLRALYSPHATCACVRLQDQVRRLDNVTLGATVARYAYIPAIKGERGRLPLFDEMTTSASHPLADVDLREMVLSYLVHHCYSATAELLFDGSHLDLKLQKNIENRSRMESCCVYL